MGEMWKDFVNSKNREIHKRYIANTVTNCCEGLNNSKLLTKEYMERGNTEDAWTLCDALYNTQLKNDDDLNIVVSILIAAGQKQVAKIMRAYKKTNEELVVRPMVAPAAAPKVVKLEDVKEQSSVVEDMESEKKVVKRSAKLPVGLLQLFEGSTTAASESKDGKEQTKTGFKPEVKTAGKPEAKTKLEPPAKTEQVAAKADLKPEAKAKIEQPDLKLEAKVKIERPAKTEPVVARAVFKPEPKAKIEPEAKAILKPSAKTEPVVRKVGWILEAIREANPKREPIVKTEPKSKTIHDLPAKAKLEATPKLQPPPKNKPETKSNWVSVAEAPWKLGNKPTKHEPLSKTPQAAKPKVKPETETEQDIKQSKSQPLSKTEPETKSKREPLAKTEPELKPEPDPLTKIKHDPQPHQSTSESKPWRPLQEPLPSMDPSEKSTNNNNNQGTSTPVDNSFRYIGNNANNIKGNGIVVGNNNKVEDKSFNKNLNTKSHNSTTMKEEVDTLDSIKSMIRRDKLQGAPDQNPKPRFQSPSPDSGEGENNNDNNNHARMAPDNTFIYIGENANNVKGNDIVVGNHNNVTDESQHKALNLDSHNATVGGDTGIAMSQRELLKKQALAGLLSKQSGSKPHIHVSTTAGEKLDRLVVSSAKKWHAFSRWRKEHVPVIGRVPKTAAIVNVDSVATTMDGTQIPVKMMMDSRMLSSYELAMQQKY